MINYSPITINQLVDNVIQQVGKFRNNINVSWYEIATFVNHAIREIFVKTLPYKDWAYISTLPVADNTALPRTMLKQIRVLLNNNGITVEARYSTPREFFKTTYSTGMDFVNSYLIQPIYTIWGQTDLTGALPEPQQVIYIKPTTLTGIMDCYIVPAFTYVGTQPAGIPYEYETFIIYSAATRFLSKYAGDEQITALHRDLMLEQQKLIRIFVEKQRTEKRELDSFVEPVPPIIPEQPMEGEARIRL